VEISYCVSGWEVFDAHFAIGDSIGEVASDIDMPGTLATGLPAVVFEFDHTLVVLVTDIILNLFLLGFQEVLAPNHLGEDIVYSYQFRFRGILGIQLLFAGL